MEKKAEQMLIFILLFPTSTIKLLHKKTKFETIIQLYFILGSAFCRKMHNLRPVPNRTFDNFADS